VAFPGGITSRQTDFAVIGAPDAAWQGIGYTLRRYYVDSFYSRTVPDLSKDSLVLDLGGLKTRKRGQFDLERYPLRSVYLNISRDRRPDAQGDAALIPFGSGTFDAVICSELLEHVPDPRAVLSEVFRVLKPCGILLGTVPFLYRIHGDPEDYGRYTDHYWRQSLRQVGFIRIDVEKQGLFFSVLVDFLKQYLCEVRVHKIFGRITTQVVRVLQLWALRKERHQRLHTHPFIASFTTGFAFVAGKAQWSPKGLVEAKSPPVGGFLTPSVS
jgi:SAM-dependent methyltransferase